MKHRRRILILGMLVLFIMFHGYSFVDFSGLSSDTNSNEKEDFSTVELDNGETIEVGPNEELHKYILTEQGWTEWTGLSSDLSGREYGNRSDTFSDESLQYNTDNTTTESQVAIPTGTDWQADSVDVEITDLTENRTWLTNPDFTDNSNGWTLDTAGDGGSSYATSEWLADGHGVGDDCIEFEINSTSPGPTFWYNADDKGYATQTTTVDRGSVVWSALRLDYWADTYDDTHYGMTGSFSIYFDVEGTRVWEKVFDSIGAEETWYDSGLVSVSPSVYSLTSVSVEFGLLSKESVGYSPNLNPLARVDNVVLYMKTKADPSDVNLEMNGLTVSNGASEGTGSITDSLDFLEVNPVLLNFSWTPSPVNPDPNKTITVDFDVSTNLYARRINIPTLYEISPTSFGERFTIQNATDATYTTYFYADIPDGYPNRYYLDLTIPSSRDVFFVARPLAPSTNLTSGWYNGAIGDEKVNVTAYDVTTEAGRYGYWRIKSESPNMIDDVELWDPDSSSWTRNADLRAGNNSRVRVNVGAGFAGSIVNITVYDPEGTAWNTYNVTADGSGYATTPYFNLAGTNSSAGEWMVQAVSNDKGTNSDWTSTGFFKRPFSITHVSKITLDYPDDAVLDNTANVTYGDLLLLIYNATDTDSNTMISDGTLEFDWVLGKDTFDDSGNGQYTKVLDTSLLPGKGQYVVDLEWSHYNFDNSTDQLTVNVNYAAELTSPDYPGIAGPIGINQTFDVWFKNVNGTGIPSADIKCNWSGGYEITDNGNGLYSIELDTSSAAIDIYPITINATSVFVEPQSMLLYVEVREIYNTISYSANQLSIPVGENSSFIFTWTNLDTGQPITGGAGFITCNWTDFHTTGDPNYTISEISPGQYNITIHTLSDDPLTDTGEFYNVLFEVNRSGYQNHTFEIGVQIRSHNTLFVLDSPIEQTLIGETIVVLVDYQDIDLDEGIINDTSEVQITVSTPELTILSYSVSASSLGDGHYNITIPSNQWGTIGRKNLTIYVEWTGAVTKYYSQTIETSVRIVGTDTDLFLEQAPTATYYLENFTFTSVYYDAINETRVSNSTDSVFLTITPLTSGHTVTQTEFYVYESGANPGTYVFEVNTSFFLDTGSYRFEIAFKWKSGTAPYYENKTMSVTLIILERPTYIDFVPIPSTPYGENAQFEFSYVDTLSNEKIENSTELIITLNEAYVEYTIGYSVGTRVFVMNINTSSMGGTGVFSLHLNFTWVGEPFYTDIESQTFTLTVSLRTTQLSHLSFSPGEWANNVSIEFVYTDLVAGSSYGMTGILSLNTSLAGWYTVTSLAEPGHYLLELNTSAFPSDGQYMINASIIYTGSNYASNAYEVFGLTVLKRATQLGYDSPDAAPYLTNVTLTISYSDDTTSVGISGATLSVTCSNSSSALILGANYWFDDLGSGDYLVEVSTVALGDIGAFELNVTVSKSGSPYYKSISKLIVSRVIERTTQILITKTPGETPFLENVTLRFKYTDFLTGSVITIDKSHVTLDYSGSYVFSLDEYSLTFYSGGDSYYEISFNSTTLDAVSLVTGVSIGLTIDKTGVVPFYAARSTSTVASTVERTTQILFPLVEETPYFDNITIQFEYVDYLSSAGIPSANVFINIQNFTSATYYIEDIGDGTYIIRVPTTQFGALGTIYFDVLVNKSGVPFFAERTSINVPATIRSVQLSASVETPPAGIIPVGEPLVINLTLLDSDHDIVLTGADVSSNWTTRVTVDEVGSGLYTLTFNTTGLVADLYSISIEAEKTFYQTLNLTVDVQPGSATFTITLSSNTYYADWGQSVQVRLSVREIFFGTLVPGMNSTVVWAGQTIIFTDHQNGTYTGTLDTDLDDYGTYELQLTVSREFYQTRQKKFNLVVTKATGQIVAETTALDVTIGTNRTFWIFINDTLSDRPVETGTVSIEWNDTIYALSNNGSLGFYTADLNVSGFAIGQYNLKIIATSTNYDFLDVNIDVNVVPVSTKLEMLGGQTSIVAYYGETIMIDIEFNDTFHGGYILGANVSYTISNVSGEFTENVDGTYSVEINTTSLVAQTYYLRITATKQDYATGKRTFITTIQPITTDVSVDTVTQEAYHGDTLEFVFYYNDTQNNEPVSGAEVEIVWEGDAPILIDHNNGSYTLKLNITPTVPRLYDVKVTFVVTNYDTATKRINIIIRPTPGEIVGPTSLSVPVNDTASYLYSLFNRLSEEQISGINGIAFWEGIGPSSMVLLENGSYQLEIPDDLPINTYRIEISFSSTQYTIPTLSVELQVRTVHTTILVDSTTIATSPGSALEITISYYDLDHNIGISGVVPEVALSEGNITYYPLRTYEPYNNGTYVLYFLANAEGEFIITVTFSKGDYETQIETFDVNSGISAEQATAQTLMIGGSIALLFVAFLIVGYVKVWSVPWLIRVMNKMLGVLGKRKIPKPASVRGRGEMVLEIANEELAPLKIQKNIDDVEAETIKAVVPEVNELLDRLVEITGLGEVELDAFRRDLSRMRPSDRPGFLMEVIRQEEARRAEQIEAKKAKKVAEPEAKEIEDEESMPLAERPDEMEELTKKLKRKGMSTEEIEVILEQAKTLSKADLKALLESLGIDI